MKNNSNDERFKKMSGKKFNRVNCEDEDTDYYLSLIHIYFFEFLPYSAVVLIITLMFLNMSKIILINFFKSSFRTKLYTFTT